jgi:hypothetical protein
MTDTGTLAFVHGTGRCGTTLVQEAIARHPEVGFISNIDDKFSHLNLAGRWNSALYRRTSPRDPGLRPLRDRRRLVEKGRLRVAPSEGWNVLDRQVLAGFSQPCRDLVAADLTPYLERRLQGFFRRRMEAQGSSVFLHRLTGWPRTGLLRAAFPETRVVNVVRDGRAVANSWLQMGWWDGYRGPENWYLGPLPPEYRQEWEDRGRSFPVLAALGWKVLMAAFDEARAAFPADQWLDVRYEDVLREPRDSFAEILDFLGLEWTAEFESGLARHHFEAGRGVAYRKDLRPTDLALMEEVIAEPLQAWGYELSAGQGPGDRMVVSLHQHRESVERGRAARPARAGHAR